MRRLSIILLSILALPLEGLAQQAGNFALVSPPTPTRRYGMAGCGLGSVLLPNGPQVLTSIINNLFWNQVFVISSGTSNCQSDPTRQVGVDQEHLMKSNYRNIAREAAQGEGETLYALASAFGCPQQKEKEFASFTQRKHSKIFTQPGALAALHALRQELSTDPALTQSCIFASATNYQQHAQVED